MNKTQITKDFKQKSILVSREFKAPIGDVWKAYTTAELLDQWWGPAPWRAETKSMNFSVGGYWLYAMVSPEGQKHYAKMTYRDINYLKCFEAEDGFCDENGTLIPGMPVSTGECTFTETSNGTNVAFKLTYTSENDLQKIIEMGFEQGISICNDQLEALFEKHKI
ncbi:MAG TPA: SRPBCC domain-containing protein [Flavisolibacter sp.]|jgi:uncharacterized protein YndB with AHSA1/START domain|nr:SRPBCC domain-containing protein [Flavisolibacter sp.]